uniref:BZIP domain-containing protein n=1 Tax=Leptocylindrus danicus TaxID=163516 RepID=A0A7S2KBW5_9STRA|mmetsp:Transcript_21053/g.31411  ORF Transcript_21053/g.31411 Transcript_21053/m.31411 type:complete len:252 (+) Transcript_21053:140-895(+)|eukprot:CAMPEP_0116029490 /NCGR_PEP_ID=MMETSP0321-20121206/16171_1 /TAXON_ID=163516 /ORGANISM="Leptocylindrus danicus var. danicus, Strain B650" /LENGTH=251 /DNA_ID=CAMNT_0003503877 /DNA_START=133 /DNA_END=888 /DNA_ORIENTATION=-
MSPNTNTSNNDATVTKRKRSGSSVGKSAEDKRKERLLANRKAAYNCRMRKRILIEELQRQVVELTRKNIAAEDENARLRVALNMKPVDNTENHNEVLVEPSTINPSEFAGTHSRNTSSGSDYGTMSLNSGLAMSGPMNGGYEHSCSSPGATVSPSLQEIVMQRQLQATESLRAALMQYQHNAMLDGSLALPQPQLVGRRDSVGSLSHINRADQRSQQSQPCTAYDLISHNQQISQNTLPADFQNYTAYGGM